ncbi:hypothetical protein ATERTT37_003797 [Aspergillus terreus]
MDSKGDMKLQADTVSSDHEAQIGHVAIDPVKEKKLLRKMDLCICPLEEIHLVGNQLGNGVTLFYATYVFFEIPFSMVLKKLRPNRLISALIFGFSVSILAAGFIKNVAGLYVTRCLTIVLTTFYKREEQAQRISYLFVSAALSGGFGGLLAFGLVRLEGVGGLSGWRWLFIIEGLMSAVIGIATFFLLPNNYETAYFLNEEDKALMRLRMQSAARYADAEEFDIQEVYKTLRDPKSWLTSLNQICVNICSFGFSTFLPTIIRAFGYGSVTTQLLTVPVYLWASAFYLVVAHFSDRVRMRAAFMVPLCLVTAVGYALLLGVDVDARGPLYFATFAGQIYSSKVNRRYILGHSVSLGAICVACLGNSAMYLLLRYHNRKRDRLSPEEREEIIASGSYEKRGGDFHPDFRYIL